MIPPLLPAVMISAGFCHLLGDAIEQLTRSYKYPLAPFLCACGFMSTLIADQVVEAANHHTPAIPVLVRCQLEDNLIVVTTGHSPKAQDAQRLLLCRNTGIDLRVCLA